MVHEFQDLLVESYLFVEIKEKDFIEIRVKIKNYLMLTTCDDLISKRKIIFLQSVTD